MSTELRFSNADRASKRNPCRVCGGTDWPCVNISAEKSVCGVESHLHDTAGTWVENFGGWLHTVDPAGIDLQPRNGSATPAPRPPRRPTAGIVARDASYRKLLPLSPPIPEHMDHLVSDKRGLKCEQVAARGYGTGWSAKAIAEAARWCEAKPDAAFGIPGIGDTIHGAGLMQYTAPRILIPVRDSEGRIQGLQAYDPKAKSKGDRYRWVSSAGSIGASLSPPPLHVSRPTTGEAEPGTVWLTEGPFKADICSDLLGSVFVAFQGVDCLRMRDLDAVLEDLGGPDVILAIDADREHNADVRRVFESICSHLAERGIRYGVASWDAAEGKGLDDLLLADGKFAVEWATIERVEESREFIELAFVVAACESQGKAHVLKAFPDGAFKVPAAKHATRAVRRILAREEEVTLFGLGPEMAKRGAWAMWQDLCAFEEQHRARLRKALPTAERAFREAYAWDFAEELIAEFGPTVRKGEFREWITKLFTQTTRLVADADSDKENDFHQDLMEWAEEFLKGEHEKGKFEIFKGRLGEVVGKAGPGNIIALGGASKMGKSSFAWEPVFEAASKGRGVIVVNLEMTVKEQCFRAACWLLQKGERDITDDDVRWLIANKKLEWVKNIKLITYCADLDDYIAKVNRLCATRPDFFKLLVTDQAEWLMEHKGSGELVTEANRGARVFKQLAMVWGMAHIVLLQYRREYKEKDGRDGPKIWHLANSSKYEKDCHIAILLHRPSLFHECPEDYIELHIPIRRSGGGGGDVVPMKWYPDQYRYENWEGPIPAACGHSLGDQVGIQGGKVRKPLPAGGRATPIPSPRNAPKIEYDEIDDDTAEAIGKW